MYVCISLSLYIYIYIYIYIYMGPVRKKHRPPEGESEKEDLTMQITMKSREHTFIVVLLC